jgi:phage protein D
MSALPRYAPDFHLEIDGTPTPAILRNCVTSLSLQTGLEGADRVELSLANEGLRWLDHPLLSLKRELSVLMGYSPDPLHKMFVGEIVGHNAAFPSSGYPTLNVVAQDRRYRMQKGNRARIFAVSIPELANIPIPDPVIAAAVALSHGMLPVTDLLGAALAILLGGVEVVIAQAEAASSPSGLDAAQKQIRKQVGMSDYEFLALVARENGWDMSVDHDGPLGGRVIRFSSPAYKLDEDITLKWGRDLIDFSPRITNVGQIASVTAFVWKPSDQTSIAVTVGWDWDRQSLSLVIKPVGAGDAGAATNASGQGAGEQGDIFLVDRPATLANAPRIIIGELLPRLNNRLTAKGSTVGDPRIRAASVIQVEGVGEQFGGRYRVTSATHTIDAGGWRTSFDCRKDIWFGSIPLPEQGALPIRVADSLGGTA